MVLSLVILPLDQEPLKTYKRRQGRISSNITIRSGTK
jgi:hypothetical protein